MKIGEVAARSGVPAKTIRFWEEQRLLPEPRRTPAGYRLYESSTIQRLTFVRQAQAAGFALDQIRQVLDIGDSGTAPCEHVSDLIARRLVDVVARIGELEATRDHLRVLAKRAAEQNPAECRGYCSILRH
jgi:DNA-binding transcriptional MerR regulator